MGQVSVGVEIEPRGKSGQNQVLNEKAPVLTVLNVRFPPLIQNVAQSAESKRVNILNVCLRETGCKCLP